MEERKLGADTVVSLQSKAQTTADIKGSRVVLPYSFVSVHSIFQLV
ncbi:hypothetical protein [Alteribacillus sp. YIM 98480]|nr:hypothetical protein [Alteribacillus sp. YIM 98480]